MLPYLLTCVAILGLAYGLYRLWRRTVDRDLAEGATFEWQTLQRTDPALIEHLDEAAFARIYHHTHFPRFPGYIVVALAIFLLGSPIVLGLLSGSVHFGLRWGWIPQPGEAATDLYLGSEDASLVRKFNPEALAYILQGWSGFYYFFGMLGFWIATVFFTMQRYHRRTPGTLREEILRTR